MHNLALSTIPRALPTPGYRPAKPSCRSNPTPHLTRRATCSWGALKPRSVASRALQTDAGSPARTDSADGFVSEADIVVIGSGIGGLSCGAILAKYGLKVQ